MDAIVFKDIEPFLDEAMHLIPQEARRQAIEYVPIQLSVIEGALPSLLKTWRLEEEQRVDALRLIAAYSLSAHAVGRLDHIIDKDNKPGKWPDLQHTGSSLIRAFGMIVDSLAIAYRSTTPEGLEAARIFHQGFLDASRSEIADLEAQYALVSPKEYQENILGKASSLLGSFFEALAHIGTSAEKERALIRQFGEAIGVLIQIGNDVTSTWTVDGLQLEDSDLEKRNITLPISYLYTEGAEDVKHELMKFWAWQVSNTTLIYDALNSQKCRLFTGECLRQVFEFTRSTIIDLPASYPQDELLSYAESFVPRQLHRQK